jgi:hypothetical protein
MQRPSTASLVHSNEPRQVRAFCRSLSVDEFARPFPAVTGRSGTSSPLATLDVMLTEQVDARRRPKHAARRGPPAVHRCVTRSRCDVTTGLDQILARAANHQQFWPRSAV